MNDFRSLKFLDLFQALFRALKIDYKTMRKILQIKLTMDERRVPTIFAGQSANKQKNNQFLKSLGIYALYGLILIPFLFLGEHLMLQTSILFGIAMFILMTSMISDFSSVLLDVRDKTILETKPLSPRTVSAAKLVHVTIYMTMLTGAFIAAPAVVMIIEKGITFLLLFLAEIILMLLLILTLTALTYIFVLRFFDGERLRDIINYVQILLSVGIIVGYQIVIRAFDFVDFDHLVYVFSWWHIFIPPIWFGAPFSLFLQHDHSSTMIALSLMALLIPIISILIYYRLMPTFERNLQKLMEGTAKAKKKREGIQNFWAHVLCFSQEERVFFRFTSVMLSREREFKLKVYPTLGMSIVFPFIFIFNGLSNGTESLKSIADSNVYFTIYVVTIMIGTVVHTMKFSEKYAGAWIFQILPIQQETRFYKAALKAFIVKLFLPVFLLVSVVYTAIFTTRIIPDLAVVLAASILLTLIGYKITNDEIYPFSRPSDLAQQGANSILFIALMIITAAFGFVHYIATKIDYGVYGYLVLLIVANFIAWKLVFPKKKRTA